MGSDKTPDEMIAEISKAFQERGGTIQKLDEKEKKVKRQAKRQRQKMRKRGIKLFQDYCR